MGLKKTTSNRRNGQALVEFALVLPLLLIFVVGILEFGMYINDHINLSSACAEASRLASQLQFADNADEMVLSQLFKSADNLNPANISVVNFQTGNTSSSYSINSQTGRVSTTTGEPVSPTGSSLFFISDNETPHDFSDDYYVSARNWKANYVRVDLNYQRRTLTPFANLIGIDTATINVSNTLPLTTNAFETGRTHDYSVDGAMPMVVRLDPNWNPGDQVTLKGDNLGPGSFGWADLSYGAFQGNANEQLAKYITGEEEATVYISGEIKFDGSFDDGLDTFTGQKNSVVIRDALDTVSGMTALFPLFDVVDGTGINLEYRVIGFALFQIQDFDVGNAPGGQYLDINGTYLKTVYLHY